MWFLNRFDHHLGSDFDHFGHVGMFFKRRYYINFNCQQRYSDNYQIIIREYQGKENRKETQKATWQVLRTTLNEVSDVNTTDRTANRRPKIMTSHENRQMMGEEKANAINYARQAEDGGNPSTDIIGT